MIHIQLNKHGVSAPAIRLVTLVSGAITAALQSMDDFDCSAPIEIRGRGIGFKLEGESLGKEERRHAYKSWILAKGFHDLSRGLRLSLEGAYLWIELLKHEGKQIPNGDFEALATKLKIEANKLYFPQLLQAVNGGLQSNLMWDTQFHSLQKVRNCLEHRNGIVAAGIDTGQSDTIQLSFPRFMVFAKTESGEVEALPGTLFDASDQLMFRLTTRERAYRVGERIDFSAEEFGEIAMACWIMAQDIASRLPEPRIIPAAAHN